MLPRAAIIGAGRVLKRMANGVREWFLPSLIYDPDPNAVAWPEFSDVNGLIAAASEDEFFSAATQADAVFVLSPPAEHARQLKAAASLNKPVFIEKPLAIDIDGLRLIDDSVKSNPRVYFSDFYPDVRAAGFMVAFGGRPGRINWVAPRTDSVQGICPLEGLRERLGPIRAIHARLLEGEGEAKSLDTRPWLRDPRGGGVLLDLAYHHLNLYFALFDASLLIRQAHLGLHLAGATGLDYLPWNPLSGQAETYARLEFQSAAGFPVYIEVGKNWNQDCRDFRITGRDGRVLLDFGRLAGPKNTLHITIGRSEGQILPQQNYWDLVAEGFYHYLISAPREPHGYYEGTAALETILRVREKAAAAVPFSQPS